MRGIALKSCVLLLAGTAALHGTNCKDEDKKRSVFLLLDRSGAPIGTAFLLTLEKEKVFVTTVHELKSYLPSQDITLIQPALDKKSTRRITVKLDAILQDEDLAILKSNGNSLLPDSLFPTPLENAVVSDPVFVVGYPHPTLHDIAQTTRVSVQDGGMLVPLDRHFAGFSKGLLPRIPAPGTRVIGLTGPIQPGESGSPLLDNDCRVHGVVIGSWQVKAVRNGHEDLVEVGIGRAYAVPIAGKRTPVNEIKDWNKVRGALAEGPYQRTGAEGSMGIPIPSLPNTPVPMALMRTEVTNAEFQRVCAPRKAKDLCNQATRMDPGHERYPVTGLSGKEAELICQRLFEGHKGRLPTIDEWWSMAQWIRGTSGALFNLADSSSKSNRIEPMENRSGFVDFFGNVFEFVSISPAKYTLVGGSHYTLSKQLWEGAVDVVGNVRRWSTTRVLPSERGFRCAFEE